MYWWSWSSHIYKGVAPMVVRVVEVKTKPGKAREVCDTLHEKVLSTLKAQTGQAPSLPHSGGIATGSGDESTTETPRHGEKQLSVLFANLRVSVPPWSIFILASPGSCQAARRDGASPVSTLILGESPPVVTMSPPR